MNKFYSIICILLLHFSATGQVFWSEDFGTGCNTGNPANGFTTSNGVWSVVQTGFNEVYANEWYISGHTSNTGAGNCADDCAGGANNQTLHIGSVAVSLVGLTPEQGSYLTGFYCTLLTICSTTHKRVESPVIDCTGKTGISLSFIYFEGGDLTPGGTNGSADLWYYDGTAWSMLDVLAKTSNGSCSGTIYGVWTNFSVSLPSSADNNPNVKLGFVWDNDDVSVGSDPSAGFDDIELSSGSGGTLPVAGFSSTTATGCDSVCVIFTDTSSGGTSSSWSFPGGTPSSATTQVVTVCYSTPGIYDVTLVSTNATGSDTVTEAGYVTVNNTPIPDFSVSDQNICLGQCIDFTDLSTGGPQVYTWTFAGGTPLNSNVPSPTGICYLTPGVFSVTLAIESGICINTITRANYINVNQPVTPTVNLMGDTLFSSSALTYQWYSVATGAIPAAIFQFYVATQTGDYYVCTQDAFGCEACSDTVYVDLTDVYEINSPRLTVYPNPATDEINVKGNRVLAHAEISIKDITGRTIKRLTVTGRTERLRISISDLESGSYILAIEINQTTTFINSFIKL